MKKILLTTAYINNYTGSEVNTLDLAVTFQDLGHEVIVGTFLYREPLKQDFEELGINVYNMLLEELPFDHYDLIWSQHYTTLEYVIFGKNLTADKIIFSSLSHFEPLETPPIFANDLSLIVAHSEENKRHLLESGVKKNNLVVLKNSVINEYFNKEVNIGKLNRIAVVSNHLPDEIVSAVEILEEEGIEVDIYGKGYEEILVNAELLSKYDAIVTIGRTVQYGLALGIPVYCYDHFGGPGWITTKNIDVVEEYNFSGRDSKRKLSAQEIVDEIKGSYENASQEVGKLKSISQERYALEDNLKRILDQELPQKNVNLGMIREKYALLETNVELFVREFTSRINLEDAHKELRENYDDALKVVEELNKENADVVESKDGHIRSLEARIEGMRIKNRFLALINPITPGFMKKILEALLRRISKAVYILKNDGPIVLVKNTVGFIFDRNYSHLKMYTRWIRKVESKWLKESKEEAKNFNDRDIKISIVMPVYNIEPKYLKKAIKSLRNQTYPNWELCMHDDASTNPATIEYLKKLDGNDERIKISFGEENGHISYATNQALKLAGGEFVLFMDNDDELAEVALYEIVKRIKENPKADLIYYDEDVISQEGRRIHPIFKPQYSPDTLLSIMYMAHSTYRRSLLEDLGGMREGYEGSQDYDLCLRAVEKTDQIEHIPHILYHWRQAPGSTAGGYDKKDYVYQSAWKAHEDAIERRNLDAEVEEGLTPVSFRIKYSIKESPKVSVIIPTKDHVDDVEKCITSIREKTDYDNYEILIVNNNSEKMESKEYFEKISQEDNIRVLDYPRKFNFAAINNFAVKQAKGEHVLLLNNDTEVITPGWMSAMLEFSQQDRVGVVGAMLLFPDDTFQHAGCVLGLGGIAGHIYVGQPKVQHGLLDRTLTIHNTSAVTAACLMIRKDKYEKVGGMDEKLAVAFNDIDFCINVMESGYDNIYTPFAQLYHYESKTRGYEDTLEKQLRFKKEIDYMKDKWGKLLKNDPYYNPNLSFERDDFTPSI